MKKSLKILTYSSIFSSLAILSGCTSLNKEEKEQTPVTEEQQSIYPAVSIIKTQQKSIEPIITLSGTITTKDEITIASEATGTVQKVLKHEGDNVSEGTTLLTLESQTNLLRASYSSAAVALDNARKSVTLAKKSAQQNLKDADLQIKNAELALKNATIAYERLVKSKDFKKNSNSATKESSEKRLEIAEKNLEIAEQNLENILENTSQTYITFADSISNAIESSFILFRNDLDFIDSLIGASEFREHSNDSFEISLKGESGNLINTMQTDWRILTKDIQDLEKYFTNFSQAQYSDTDYETLLPILSNTIEKAEMVKNNLRDLEKMLDLSISSLSFPETKITELKTQVKNMQSVLTERTATLKSIRQNIADFTIQQQQQTSSAELAITIRESEVLSQKSQDIAVENSKGTTDIAIDSEIEASKNAVDNAKNAVEFAKSQKVSISIQGDLAIQTAIAQMDAAQSMLDQAALSLSKLTITSGITGTVSKVLAFAGDTVSPGTPLVIISDYSELKLVSDVSHEESFLLRKGMKAEVSIDGISKVFVGKISTIYPEADKITRRVRIEVLIPNTDKIPANVFATARIKLKKQKPTIYIPSEVLTSANPPSVMILQRKRCKKSKDTAQEKCIAEYEGQKLYTLETKEIEIGTEERGFGIPVLSGLRRNQYILNEKGNFLFNGDIVMIKNNTILDNNTTEEIEEVKNATPEIKREDKKDTEEKKEEDIHA